MLFESAGEVIESLDVLNQLSLHRGWIMRRRQAQWGRLLTSH